MPHYFINDCGNLEQRNCSASELERDNDLMEAAAEQDALIIRWNEEVQTFELAYIRPDEDGWVIHWNAP